MAVTQNGQTIRATVSQIAYLALPIANNTVLGNVSGASAAPSALSQAQLQTLVGISAFGVTLVGQTTAALARATLGSSATGDSLFTAASASAARTTLGSGATGDVLFQAASAASARSTLGSTTVGDAVFIAANAAAGRTALSAAASGANTDITSLAAPALGAATATTATPGDSSTLVATTAFAQTVVTGASNVKVPVRQTVLYGALDSNGYANHLSAGAGLNFNIAATATPLVITYANGFGAQGDVDTVTVISADASNQGSLAASNLSYITSTYASATSVTWGSTLAPPQYGYAYDRTKQSLLRFAGTNGSSTIVDDYGNSWATSGGAVISTGTQIDGLNTLDLTGAGKFIFTNSASPTGFGYGNWTVEIKVRWATLPTAGNIENVFYFSNAGAFGLQLALDNTAGTFKLRMRLSSTGTSWDIKDALGTSTTWATATTYHLAIVFDGANYYCYKDGVAEAALTTASSSKVINTMNDFRIGIDKASTSGFNGNVAGFRFLPYNAYPAGTTFTPPNISTFAVNNSTSSDFFSIPAMTMYGVTAASASAGTNPTLTAKNVVYHGEAVTGASTVASTVNYAYKGQYVSADTTIPGLATRTAFNANLGVMPLLQPTFFIRNYTAENGFTPGMTSKVLGCSDANGVGVEPGNVESRNIISVTTGSTGGTGFNIETLTGGVRQALAAASNWKMFIIANRGW
jgi:hypothetical protein